MAPAQVRFDAGYPACILKRLESLLSLNLVAIRVRPAPDMGIAGGDVRERQLAILRQQQPCKGDRIATGTVSIHPDKHATEHCPLHPKSS